MSSKAFSVVRTEVVSLTVATPATSANTYEATTLRLCANRAFHFNVAGATGTVTQSYVPANTEVFVTLAAGDDLDVLVAAGETTGSLWVDEIRFS